MRWALLSLVLVVAGCADDPATQLVVLVDSDFTVPGELADVDVHVRSNGEEISSQRFALVGAEGEAGPSRFRLPLSFGVVPANGDASRRITVVVTGLDPEGRALVTRRAVTGFVRGQSLLLPMFLARRCVTEADRCAPDETCTESGCESAAVPPSSLVEVEPGQELDADVERDGAIDASVDASSTDAGIDAPVDAASDAPVDSGRDSATDAGADAGTDAGPDAGALECSPVEDVGCDDGTCNCGSGCCRMTCDDPSMCDPGCSRDDCAVDARGVDTLDALCTMESSCHYDARDTSETEVLCTLSSSCDVDCRGASSCQVRCQLGAECLLRCDSGCDLVTCTGGSGTEDCGDGVKVCNRPCP